MRKKTNFVLLLFLCTISSIKNVVAVNIVTEEIPGFFVLENNIRRNMVLFKAKNQSAFLYSFGPYSEYIDSDFKYTYSDLIGKLNISKELFHEIKNIIYFGYGYLEHEDIKWYVLIQNIIWKKLGLDIKVIDEQNVDIFDKYKEEYDKLEIILDEFYKLPSYCELDTIDINYSEEYLLYDSNNVEKNYNLAESAYLVIKNKNNKKYITSSRPTQGSIYCSRISNDNSSNILYYNDNMFLINRAGLNAFSKQTSFNVHGGFISLKNIDNDNNLINGSVFVIFNSNGVKVDQITIKDNGVGISRYLPPGEYFITQKSVSDEYIIITDPVKITLNDYVATEVQVVNEKKTATINITLAYKYLNDSATFYEQGAVFAIYGENGLIKELITDNNGAVSFDLPYGIYTVRQISSNLGHEQQEEFIIEVKEDDDLNYDFIYEKDEYNFNIICNSVSKLDFSTIKCINIKKSNEEVIDVIDDFQIFGNIISFDAYLNEGEYIIEILFNEYNKSSYMVNPIVLNLTKSISHALNIFAKIESEIKKVPLLNKENAYLTKDEENASTGKEYIDITVPSTGCDINIVFQIIVLIIAFGIYKYEAN